MTTILIGIICILTVALLWALFFRKSEKEQKVSELEDHQPSEQDAIPYANSPQLEHKKIFHRPLYNTTETYPENVLTTKAVPTSLQSHFKRLQTYFTVQSISGKRVITAEFNNVADAIRRGEQIILVTGGAGTGKTTLIEWLIEQGLADVVLAFTGTAALNCHGKTIHSFFQLPVGLVETSTKLGSLKEETVALVQNSHIIVIDEISMVRADLMDAIDRRIREVLNTELPFGGMQLLLVGDPFQLPPVVSKLEEPYFRKDRPECIWKSAWFFDAHVFHSCKISHYALTEVFRQNKEEKEYIHFLNLARKGKNLSQVIEYFNSHCLAETEETNVVTLTAKNSEAEARNKNELNKLPGNLFVSTAICTGAFAQILHKIIKNSTRDNPDYVDDMIKFPAPYQLSLRVGAFVMILINDPERRFVNGSTGIVQKINEEESYIDVQLINGNTVSITKHKWDSENIEWNPKEKKIDRYIDGEFSQYPLRLAWAITTHKAQGRTFPKAQIYYSDSAFQHGQIYVALSRTRSVYDLKLLRGLTINDFPKDKRLNEWITTLYSHE